MPNERQPGLFHFPWITWAILGLPEGLLALRFVLKLMGADPNSGLAVFVYALTGPFIAPFIGPVSTRLSGAAALEIAALIAMAVYAQLFWAMVTVGLIVMIQLRTRTVSGPTRTAA
jgi:hypothetical protein